MQSGFYKPQQILANGAVLTTLFSTLDEDYHSKLRRAVNNAYAMTSLVQFEPLVDSTTSVFLQQMDKRYANKEDESGALDFGKWLQFYAFDVICELTFSRRLGFVDRGLDIENIISSLEWMLGYAAVVSDASIPFTACVDYCTRSVKYLFWISSS